MELIPAQTTALRLFVSVADQLRVPPADGLVGRVRGARREPGTNRHVLYLSQEQMESVAYGFWLHKMSGSALEANRFALDYNLAHHPVLTTQPSVSTRASAGLTSFGQSGPAPALGQPHHHRSRTPRTPAEPS
ncbi:DUF6417 family protein [Streptomyces sp. NPDC054884]|uniref:DUF6417 family protein n=1 Tax=Streptomyces sp. ME08-AFT2 TaxID=3028683 RepID=UPI0039F67987